jgi:hypothetical protein
MDDEGIKRTHCEKIVDGKVIKKKGYDSLDEAILQAKIINVHPTVTEKNVPYKCTVCHKYHVGRNGKPITEKYKKKLVREFQIMKAQKKIERIKNATFKIIGKIDLSKIPKK